MNRRSAIALTAAAVAPLYLTGRLITDHTGAAAQTAAAAPSFLFVQTASKIDYKDGVITLHDVPRQTLFFTDRPSRVVGNLPTDKFVAKWTTDKGPSGFATVPPNAAVTVFQSDGPKTAIVELTNPRMNGNSLSYNVKILQGIQAAQPGAGVVFIDNYTGWAADAFASSHPG
jgi:hypothetical protein